MLKENEQKANKKGSWFSTHPPLSDRIIKCEESLNNYQDADSLAILNDRFMTFKKKII